jgi:integrase
MPKRGPKTGSGEGSVYQRASDGRWVASFSDVSGRRRQLYADSEREVRRRLRTALAERDRGISTTDLTLGQWLHQWLAAPDLRPTTVADYGYKVALLPGWVLRPRLGGALPQRRATRPRRDRRQPHRHRQDASSIHRGPGSVRAPSRARPGGTLGARRSQRRIAGRRTGGGRARDRAAHDRRGTCPPRRARRPPTRVPLHRRRRGRTAPRRGPVPQWADVDLEGATLRVRRQLTTTNRGEVVIGPPKTRGSVRRLALPSFCVTRLEEHRRAQNAERETAGDAWQDNDLVWPSRLGTPLLPRNLLRHLHRTCECAGIRRVSFHTLRHSAATIMLAEGVPERVIMDVLGHSTSTTAMMVRYQHVTDALRDDAAAAMDRAFRDPDET